ncbi:MAG: outer membrane lipoprotein-sorting protein [Candidatus Bipolaricaulota bacterium]
MNYSKGAANMNSGRWIVAAVVALGVLGASRVGFAAPSGLTGRQIIENVNAVETADDARMSMSMTLINSQGEAISREIHTWKLGNEKTALVFVAPEDVAGTSFLTIETDGDDDAWLYLPALGLTKRIDAGSRSQSFMGSDFTYDDMGDRDIDAYEYTFLREDTIEGEHVLVVEGTAVDPQGSGYSKVVTWIRDDIWMPVMVEYYDLNGDLQKVQTNPRIENIDGYWAVTRMQMENVQIDHKTIVEMSQVEVNAGTPQELFTSGALPTLQDRVP